MIIYGIFHLSKFKNKHMKKKIKHIYIILSFIIVVSAFLSCSNDDYIPKPKGYFRIDLPKYEIKTFDTIFPYKFNYPSYGKILIDNRKTSEPYWLNIDFPKLNGRLYLSYKKVNKNLSKYIEDSREFTMKHIPKASAINETPYINKSKKVYGLIYDIEGDATASVYQFYLTDSTKNFVRGALYFNTLPNNDSLAPVISFIKKDLDVFIKSFEWK